jgi:uncharacterized surface protein with fasciclin (FAS1) repeats
MIRKVIALTGIAALAAAAFILAPAETKTAEAGKGPTIVDIAAGNPDFTTLVAAVQEAGLVDTLNGNRQFTVFAPTNDAFADIGLNAGNIGTVPDEDLKGILLYHVAPGNREASDVLDSDKIRTMSREFLYPVLTDSGLTIEAENSTANVVAADIDASNGVIHVVDTVLLP